ncbi:glutathione synthase [Glaciecola sp. XM2]|uniref:glutathione synthase n=1 Tax=Glaciecola sp. XM2 TaxID=1914931 RepID=UPI002032B3D6|nr:glutathione synthase [Glaciecola sp. XM2]
MSSRKLGMVMDPITAINTKKDTSFALMLEAQRRGYTLYYIQQKDMSIDNGQPLARSQIITVTDSPDNYYNVQSEQQINLGELDVILMRKDPPFDSEFLYATHILELAERAGALVVNKPQALRDFNEKLFTALYPQFIPDTLVTTQKSDFRAFHQKHKDIICKPLDGMGGTSIFRVTEDGTNLGVIAEVLTENGTRHAMVQRYMPEIKAGDKRILLIDGEVIPYCLARLPAANETRGNLAAGGSGVAQEVSNEDMKVATAIAKDMPARGILLVGLDMIGNKVTEINITSPTCVREIEAAYPINICGKIFDAVEKRL